MYTRKILLFVVGFIALFSACEEQESPLTADSSLEKGFHPAVIKSLKTYNLRLSDFQDNGSQARSGSFQSARVAQKTITVGSETITYFETSGKGPDVLLVHGTGQSSKSFSHQLNSILGSVFHIISIDLPGHGSSQYSPNPAVAYQLPGHADLLVNVVDQLDMENAVMVGWSMGGNIILEASDRLTSARGIMIFGSTPVPNPFDPTIFLPNEAFGLLFKPDLSEAEIQALVPSLFRPGFEPIPEEFYNDVRIQDPLARLFLGVTVGTGNYKDQVAIVGNLTVPLAVLNGEQEQITSTAYLRSLTIPTLWHNKVWLIPNAGHMAQWENPFYFNVLLAAFVIDMNI